MKPAQSTTLSSDTQDFKKSISSLIQVNKCHVTPADWARISTLYPYASSAWVAVPTEDVRFLELLVRDGCSYAYASLLQSCDRNNIEWIHFSKDYPLIRGLEVFTDEWRTQTA
jgi:hypothetical protein